MGGSPGFRWDTFYTYIYITVFWGDCSVRFTGMALAHIPLLVTKRLNKLFNIEGWYVSRNSHFSTIREVLKSIYFYFHEGLGHDEEFWPRPHKKNRNDPKDIDSGLKSELKLSKKVGVNRTIWRLDECTAVFTL